MVSNLLNIHLTSKEMYFDELISLCRFSAKTLPDYLVQLFSYGKRVIVA
ncbi:MAG: hypothetical protein JJW01_03445 [Alphaproteobacteria bacterium]|nr:hypothetical protein [Rickettsiales bacterium]